MSDQERRQWGDGEWSLSATREGNAVTVARGERGPTVVVTCPSEALAVDALRGMTETMAAGWVCLAARKPYAWDGCGSLMSSEPRVYEIALRFAPAAKEGQP